MSRNESPSKTIAMQRKRYQRSDDDLTLPFGVVSPRLRREASVQAGSNPVSPPDQPALAHEAVALPGRQDWSISRSRWQYRLQKMPRQQRLGYVAVGVLVILSMLSLSALFFPADGLLSQPLAYPWYVSMLNGANEQPSAEITTRTVVTVSKPDQSPPLAQTSDQALVDEAVELTVIPASEPRSPVPTEYMIVGVPAGRQERNLNCEFQSAADLVGFYGQPLSWQDVYLKVGHDPNGNPNVGFVGSSFEDLPGSLYPDGYGVYAEPLAEGLRGLGLNARAFSYRDREWLMSEISSGRPVIVWATHGLAPRELEGWHTKDGLTWIKAVRNEHTYTVVGYDGDGVYVNDPFDGQQYHYRWAAFLSSWGYLDQMAVSIQPPFLLLQPEQ